MELIKINGKKYALNLKKICDFINKNSSVPVTEKEILDNYDIEKGQIVGKSVRELTNVGNGQENIIYDLIKIVLVQVIAFDATEDISLEYLPFGTKIAFNTLLTEGFLIEKQ
jgi:hypothetical protein